MSKLAMPTFSMAVSSIARSDVYDIFSKAYIAAKV